jgi:hypothetical protein
MTLRSSLIPVAVPAWLGLRERWRVAALVVLLSALGLGLLRASGSLAQLAHDGSPGILLPALPDAGPALMWTGDARAPSTTQAKAIAELLKLLSALAWVGFGIAAFSVFSSSSTQARRRVGEIAIRRAVGASFRHSALTLLLEAVVLAGIALVIGVALGGVLRALAIRWWPGVIAAVGAAGSLPALALCALIGAASLVPLWLVRSRHLVEPADEQVGLKIPTAQVAASIALLMASATLLGASHRAARPAGGASSAGEVFQVDSGSEDRSARGIRLAALLERVSSRPGVALASLSSPGALIGVGTVDEVTTDCGRCFFGGIFLRWTRFPALAHAVSLDTFRAGRIRLLDGRLLTAADSAGQVHVAVVNRNLALRFFQSGQAVGRNLYLGPGWPTTPYRVVGVVADERAAVLGGTLQPRETVYLSVLQHPPRRVELLIRGDAGALDQRAALADLRSALGASALLGAAADETAYRGVQSRAIRWFGASFGVTALLVLAMALIGTFFAMRAWIASVAWELGLRRAMGARRCQIVSFVVWRAIGVAGGGAVLGLFLYASVLAPALSVSLTTASLARPLDLAPIGILPVFLAILAGLLPGLGSVRRAPSTFVR